MDKAEWSTIIDALRILAPTLTGIVIYQLRQLIGEKEKIERRLDAMEAWRDHHDQMDNLRFGTTQDQINDLKESRHESTRK